MLTKTKNRKKESKVKEDREEKDEVIYLGVATKVSFTMNEKLVAKCTSIFEERKS